MGQLVRLFAVVLAALTASATMVLWVDRYDVTPRDVHVVLAQLRWWPLPLILALLAGHVALAAVRWSGIEEALGASRPPFRTAFLAGAIALGLGTVLPGPLTNIAARAMSNKLGGHGIIRGALSGTADQLADLATVILFIPAAILGVVTGSLTSYLGAAAATAALGFGGILLGRPLARSVLRLQLLSRVRLPAETLLNSDLLRSLYGLSLLRFACLTAITLLVHFATGAATSGAAVIAVPLVTVAISVALLPGGLGISEWSFSAVFAAMGVAHQQIVCFVLGNRMLLSVGAIIIMTVALGRAAIGVTQRGANKPAVKATA